MICTLANGIGATKRWPPRDIPLAVTIELVSTCNLAYTITEEFQNAVVGALRMLPWPIVKRIIDEATELNVPSLLFSWRDESTVITTRTF